MTAQAKCVNFTSNSLANTSAQVKYQYNPKNVTKESHTFHKVYQLVENFRNYFFWNYRNMYLKQKLKALWVYDFHF